MDGRLLMSTLSIATTSNLSSLEKQGCSGLYCPFDIFKLNAGRLFPSNGIFKAHISYSKTPNDHTSDLKE